MPKEIMLWSNNHLRSVRSSKLRSFRIKDFVLLGDTNKSYELIGQFNSKEEFSFGMFSTEEEAKDYLVAIHLILEGKQSDGTKKQEKTERVIEKESQG